ncbi:Aste57867_9040 [Aphanomyces stellatus]|uniref:Aste57867_9040 protein n=1 Tax=Aphanomyces stellatus TaxID=120398 RepID=A0A485KM17_9STRA|nr:hypothetical protein As57867_009004 [Aphanomyces stellatus]VFT85924.1 Aste57867_9040 [Aphanomyces stellatus]
MGDDIFAVLDRLVPRGNFTPSQPDDEGVHYDVQGDEQVVHTNAIQGIQPLAIRTPQSGCDAEKGQLRELWKYRQPVVIGTGTFANMWLEMYQGNCVKKLHPNKITTQQVEYISIRRLKLVGAVWTCPSDLQCVMEYMDGGDLRDYLTCQSPVKGPTNICTS